jgi:hypothetical protein
MKDHSLAKLREQLQKLRATLAMTWRTHAEIVSRIFLVLFAFLVLIF